MYPVPNYIEDKNMKNLIIVILTFGVVALAGYTYKLQKTIQTQETLPSNADKPVVVEVPPKPEPPLL